MSPIIIIVPDSIVLWLAVGMVAAMIAIAVLSYLLWHTMQAVAVLDCVQHEHERSIDALWKIAEALLREASCKEAKEETGD